MRQHTKAEVNVKRVSVTVCGALGRMTAHHTRCALTLSGANRLVRGLFPSTDLTRSVCTLYCIRSNHESHTVLFKQPQEQLQDSLPILNKINYAMAPLTAPKTIAGKPVGPIGYGLMSKSTSRRRQTS